MNAPTPLTYADLSPDSVLDAIDSLGLRCDGTLLQLNSYENRVFQVGLEDGSQRIAKFYRPGRWSDAAILEEHAFTLELAEREVPVVPPLLLGGRTLHAVAGHRLALFARQGGRTPEIEQDETLEWLGRSLGRLHAVGAARVYQARPTLDVQTFGVASRDLLLDGGWLPEDLRAAWLAVVDQALDAVRQAYARAGDVALIRLHGDCHPGNLLWTDEGPHFVDFDDSRSGPAIQDLWMLLSGDEADMRRQFAALLRGYEMFREFDDREKHLVEALRTLRLLHHSAWIASRWSDPAFPAAFPWFGSVRCWQDRILELREQVALLQEPPRI
ncbi:serine/threonine protein kinase [Thiomonas arsenitoxydans]|uniref:serine/threonine protein kinase n=1 Tax=Thiomonas arsenitoxydans (strain DSM 22701 / CIP 110005 / 3As) TaxID=426114 RepID=UPI0005A29341|nr:serine/threonine protein kinase [Thiomonas arsenitoxydans]